MIPANRGTWIFSTRTRWLSLATGCIAGIMLASFSWPLAFAVTPVLAGGLIQPVSPRAGRWLLYAGIPLLSVPLVPAGVVGWIETFQGSRPRYDVLGLILFLAWTAAPIMLIWCNAELLREVLHKRQAH